MGNFWKTKFTIEPGFGSGSYSVSHFIWLFILFALIFLLGRSYRSADEKGRNLMRWIVASLILLDEIAKDVMTLVTGQWEWTFLPLHLCSLSVFIVLFHALTGNKILEEYLYAITLPTAAMAMIFPDWTSQLPAWNFISIHSYSIHLLLVLYSVLIIYGGFKPDWRKLVCLVPILAVIAVIMHFVNRILGTNFFFVNGGGDGANPLSVLENVIGWWYLLAIPLIAAICWLPMYLLPGREKRKNS